jgi:hypothetical protein
MRTSADDYSLAQRPRNQICHDFQALGLSKPDAGTIQKTDAMPERLELSNMLPYSKQ